MSFNLGPQAFEAIQRLKGSSDWRAVVDALQVQMSAYMHVALEVPIDNRADATAYARCLAHLVSHIAQVESATPGTRVPKIQVRMRETANA